MLSKSVRDRLDREAASNPHVRKSGAQERSSAENLKELGIDENTSFFEFFSKYTPTAMLRTVDGKELEDDDSILELTEWAYESGLDPRFILITNFEGEYFLAYSKVSHQVFGISFGEFGSANDGSLPPKWRTMESLLDDYLS